MSQDERHNRRLRVISRQIPTQSSREEILNTNDCNVSTGKVPHASATQNSNSYSRVHGKVSTEPVQWLEVQSVARNTLQEVIYRKSKGEGIAMVRLGL